MKQLIVNADDFGISPEVNEAVERAHRDGILRATSLMVAAPFATNAVERARRLPALAVGLHVVVVNGRPVLPPERVPDLVDANGCFPTNLPRAGVRYFFSPAARQQLAAEIRAQFERFAATGLTLDHVDAQSQLHVHPTVFALILRIGSEFGMRAVRMPREPFGLSYRASGDRLGARLGNSLLTEPWLAIMRARARSAGIACNDYAFGVNDPGAMTADRVLRMIALLPEGVTEMFFHPATGPFAGADAGTEHYAWDGELAALTDARVRDALDRAGIVCTTYGELASALRAA
ncbi:MAG TPA: hopanoid biosynthesis-associated protein HpnK [Candidatus Tumulicola sp.]|nr:hopanoid biosynthesis-associated protein HpnK [Candidatus Tumulicola sp.]